MTARFSAPLLVVLLAATPAQSQEQADRGPPPNARPLSEIVAVVEKRDGFRYIDEVEWEDGFWNVIYYTTDRAKVEIRYDPVSGDPG